MDSTKKPINNTCVLTAVFVLALISSQADAQDFIHYNLTDGLSGIEVTDIKGNDDFLWIATTDGLSRFDGKKFKVYKRETGNPNSLAENYIESLLFDSEGLLWIGLKSGGADIYDPKKEQFMHLRDMINSKVPVRVISIFEDSQKNIWLGTWEEGVYKLTPVKGNRKLYTVEIHYPGYIVSSIIEKPKGYLRVGTYFGFFVFDMGQKKWVDNEHQNISVTQFLDAGIENEIWCSTWNSGLIKFHWDKNKPALMSVKKQYTYKDYNAFRIIPGKAGTLYLGTWGNGIRKIFPEQSTVWNKVTGESFNASLINSLYCDKYNNIWAGTYGEGIIRFSDSETGFRHFPVTGKLDAPVISLSSTDDNSILVGTQGQGLFLLDLSTLKLIPAFGNKVRGDLKNYILSLYSDKEFIFIGSDGEGIPYAPHEHGGKKLNITIFNHSPSTEKITAFHRGANGRLWVGTKQSGLSSFRFDERSGLPCDFIHYNSFGRDEITGFADYDDSTLLISSHSGLFRFNLNTGNVAADGVLSSDLIHRIIYDKKNHCLWIGTSTEVKRMDCASIGNVVSAFEGFELPRGAVRSMISDKNNNLWFSVGGRLMCRIDKDGSIRELNSDLLGDYAILSSTAVDAGGNELLAFGTTDNLLLVDPEILLERQNKARIVLSEFQADHRKVNAGDKVFGTTVMEEASEYASSISLSYKCRWISFLFVESGLDLFVNRYQYYIKGFSDSWQYLDISNPLTFSQLSPGKYTLQIRRFDNTANSPVCWSINMTIIPPWWRTGWFTSILILFLLILASLITWLTALYNRRKHKQALVRLEKEKEDELLREKESFFTGLSHDLMTPFSLIMAPANDLVRDYPHDDTVKEKLRIILKNASFLSDIFGTILDFKRAELNDDDIRDSQIEVVAFTRMVVNAFGYLANSRNIHLGFACNIASLDVITDNVKIERILFNLISNALKYTPDGGKVDVELLFHNDGMLNLIVRDCGSGMDSKKQTLAFEKFYSDTKGEFHSNRKGLGLGLYIVRKFTNKLNGTINVKSVPGEGTEIHISIPVQIVTPIVQPENPNTVYHISEEKSTVLVVEDNTGMLDYIRNKLAPCFNVLTANSGVSALAAIEGILPEIIITDIMMPDMDGLELTQKLKENPRYGDIFIVLLTARIATDDELEGYKRGADLYIRKPFDGEVLLKQLINIHTTRQKRKSQIISWLMSGEQQEGIDFDPKEMFLQRSMQIVEEHIMDAGFKIEEFASAMNVSKTVLHRKFRLLIGETPNQFIRLVRLRKSVHLLQTTDHSIAEIAYLTGFNQSHYFIKCFREIYNKTPGEFRASISASSNI